MSSTPEQALADQLERFVKEQASRFGDVISYVPMRIKEAEHSSTEPATAEGAITESATAPKHVDATPEALQGLELKLAPFANEAWTQAPTLEVLHKEIENCKRCRLWETRTKFVFGVGDPHSKVLVIGEAPGADEDAQGEPFVGRAGQLLNKMLAAVEFKREEVFIANILKSRPPNNRDPKPDEVEACEVYLWKQILLLQPKLILCLGRVAGTNLLKMNESLGRMRGQVFDFYGIKTMVTYHPAALLRNPDWKHGAWEDLKQFRRMYDELA